MFRRQLACFVLLWLFFVLASFAIVHKAMPNAILAYENLMVMCDKGERSAAKEEMQPLHQKRFGVSKQFLYTKDHQRLQSRISSMESELIFDPQGAERDVVEHFTQLTCALQEKSNHEHAQHIRCLNAGEAVYLYKSGQLEANDVAVAEYLIAGEQWPNRLESFSPFIQGNAQNVHLSLFKEPSFKAHGFEATLFDWEAGGW